MELSGYFATKKDLKRINEYYDSATNTVELTVEVPLEASKEAKEYDEIISLRMKILELEKEILILKQRVPTSQFQGDQVPYDPVTNPLYRVTC